MPLSASHTGNSSVSSKQGAGAASSLPSHHEQHMPPEAGGGGGHMVTTCRRQQWCRWRGCSSSKWGPPAGGRSGVGSKGGLSRDHPQTASVVLAGGGVSEDHSQPLFALSAVVSSDCPQPPAITSAAGWWGELCQRPISGWACATPYSPTLHLCLPSTGTQSSCPPVPFPDQDDPSL